MGIATLERNGVTVLLKLLTWARCGSWGGWLGLLGGLILLPVVRSETAGDAPSVLIVVGAVGESDYQTNFVKQAVAWTAACERASARHTLLDGTDGTLTNQLERLRSALIAEPKTGTAPFWLVLIGHGTFNGQVARLNLVGPDLSETDLAAALASFERPLVVINAASASAPFLKALSRTNRVIITSTRSGFEQNFSRFGARFAQAIADPAADLDHDGQTSVLEAFLSASAQVAEFYKTEGRLLTEHALIDDNGDGMGTPADWFRGTRATKKSKDGTSVDGVRAQQLHLVRSAEDLGLSAAQREQRDRLELEIAALRERKGEFVEDKYYAQLERLLLELAQVYAGGDGKAAGEGR